jgi:hypothetical protein
MPRAAVVEEVRRIRLGGPAYHRQGPAAGRSVSVHLASDLDHQVSTQSSFDAGRSVRHRKLHEHAEAGRVQGWHRTGRGQLECCCDEKAQLHDSLHGALDRTPATAHSGDPNPEADDTGVERQESEEARSESDLNQPRLQILSHHLKRSPPETRYGGARATLDAGASWQRSPPICRGPSAPRARESHLTHWQTSALEDGSPSP